MSPGNAIALFKQGFACIPCKKEYLKESVRKLTKLVKSGHGVQLEYTFFSKQLFNEQ